VPQARSVHSSKRLFDFFVSPFMGATEKHIALLAELAVVSRTRELQTFRRSVAEEQKRLFRNVARGSLVR
jgi:hypothetical protein